MVKVVGGASTRVDAALLAKGSIAGEVTGAPGGGGLGGVAVDVYVSGSYNPTASTMTDSSGAYVISGLDSTPVGGYQLCFDATHASGGASTDGYESQCYRHLSWYAGYEPPSGASSVPVQPGGTTKLDVSLPALGAISGTVSDSQGGGGLAGVIVEVFDSSGYYLGQSTTASDGTYEVSGLQPTPTGYHVCFDAGAATGGTSSYGYASQCFRGVPWSPGESASGSLVSVKLGKIAVVNALLEELGGLAVTVTATGGGGLSGVGVVVYDSNANIVAQGSTDPAGSYAVAGLAPTATGDTVCFDGNNATGGTSQTGYASECYNGVTWSPYSGPPAGSQPVAVVGGSSTAISAVLAPL